MENSDMRNMLLSELIDKMHGRLADKMFPPDPSSTDQPAVEGITGEMPTAQTPVPSEYPPAATEDEDGKVSSHGDSKGTETGIPEDEPTDEEIDEMLK